MLAAPLSAKSMELVARRSLEIVKLDSRIHHLQLTFRGGAKVGGGSISALAGLPKLSRLSIGK